MKNPKVSIVVPVYMVEKELDRCVESLIKQTLFDIEIILVDDGSPDRCPQICDEYATKDSRIKVVHKENGGLSDARNVGLVKARGKYILFVDSDDYITSFACEVLYMNAVSDELDIVVADAIKVKSKSEVPIVHGEESQNKIMKGSIFLKEQLRSRAMHMAAWLNLYRKDFLVENELFFKKGILHEDEQWTPRAFLKAEKVKYIKVPFYYYIIRENSITKKKDRSKNGLDLISTCYALNRIYEKLEDVELKKLLNDYLAMLFLHAVHFGDLYDQKFHQFYNKEFLIGKSLTKKNRFKTNLFIFNKKIYRIANLAFKLVKSE